MNAVACEEYEVPVVSNETLEVHIASLRLGLDEVKEDTRELRADIKSLREKVDTIYTTLRDKIDQVCGALSDRIDQNYATLIGKIDQNHSTLSEKLGRLSDDLVDLRSLVKAILWMIGGVGSLATILMTIGKALHWF